MKKSPCQRGFFHLTLLHASRCPDPPSYAAVNNKDEDLAYSESFLSCLCGSQPAGQSAESDAEFLSCLCGSQLASVLF